MTTPTVTRLIVVTVDEAIDILECARRLSPMVREMQAEEHLAWRAVLAARADAGECCQVVAHLEREHDLHHRLLAGQLEVELAWRLPGNARFRVTDRRPDPTPPAAAAPVLPFPAA